jgi:hypothetical protein
VSYDLGSTLKKRSHGFGTDRRFQIAPCEKEKLWSPPPGSYELKSDFEIGAPGSKTHKSKNHIYSFGLGRQHFRKVYMPAVPLSQDPNHPGPAMYAVPYYNIGKHSRKASMHRRHRDV